MITEAMLEERDDRVTRDIAAALAERRERAEEARREAAEAEADIARITKAVLDGQWWVLGGVLTPADRESLCECELSDRSHYLPKEAP